MIRQSPFPGPDESGLRAHHVTEVEALRQAGQFSTYFEDRVGHIENVAPKLASVFRPFNTAFRKSIEQYPSPFSTITEGILSANGNAQTAQDEVTGYFVGAFGTVSYAEQALAGREIMMEMDFDNWMKFAPVMKPRKTFRGRVQSDVTAAVVEVIEGPDTPDHVREAIEIPELTPVRYGLASIAASIIDAAATQSDTTSHR